MVVVVVAALAGASSAPFAEDSEATDVAVDAESVAFAGYANVMSGERVRDRLPLDTRVPLLRLSLLLLLLIVYKAVSLTGTNDVGISLNENDYQTKTKTQEH